MSHTTVAYRKDYGIGDTLTSQFERIATPFSQESMDTIVAAFNSMRNDVKDEKDDEKQTGMVKNVANGEFSCGFELIQNEREKFSSLNLHGRLSESYGPASGDASVRFAMNNSDNYLNLTIMYKARKDGFVVKIDNNQLNKLKLNDTAIKLLTRSDNNNNGNNDSSNKIENRIEDIIESMYGVYLIVGVAYGGEIRHTTEYSMKSNEDKKSVAGGLNAKYKNAGIEFKGDIFGDHVQSDVNKAVNIKTNSYVEPAASCDELTKLWKYFGELANLSGYDDSGDLITKITQMSQDYFDKQAMKQPMSYVLVKLNTIKCISDVLVESGNVNGLSNSLNTNLLNDSTFNKFCNELYFKLLSMKNAMIDIRANWTKAYKNNETNIPLIKGVSMYLSMVNNTIEYMQMFNTPQKINAICKKYQSIKQSQYEVSRGLIDKNASSSQPDVKKASQSLEIEKYFLQIDIFQLNDEFEMMVLDPYNKMIQGFEGIQDALSVQNASPSPSPDPTTTTTASPTGQSKHKRFKSKTFNLFEP